VIGVQQATERRCLAPPSIVMVENSLAAGGKGLSYRSIRFSAYILYHTRLSEWLVVCSKIRLYVVQSVLCPPFAAPKDCVQICALSFSRPNDCNSLCAQHWLRVYKCSSSDDDRTFHGVPPIDELYCTVYIQHAIWSTSRIIL